MTASKFAENPVVVLKVKAENYTGRIMSVLGAVTLKDNESLRKEGFEKLKGNDWQYVCFDFSGISYAASMSVLKIIPDQFAGADGEILKISEILFMTAEEAEKYIVPDVYEIKESSGEGLDIRLLQFNIQTENGNATPFRTRADMYRQLLDELQPDVVGMEEVTVNWLKWLDGYVFNDSYAGVGEARSEGGEANSIYYRKDKFDLLDSGTFWLSDTPDVPESAFELANYPRICTWVHLRDKATGAEFVHMNTHLDHNGNNSSSDGNTVRKEQIKVIFRFSRRFGSLPMFFTGDLNNRRTASSGELYALYKMIIGKSNIVDSDGVTKFKMKLADARDGALVTVDADHVATMVANYDENSTSYNPQREPIDYIFYSPASTEALTYESFLIERNGAYISDHLPVFGTFVVKIPKQ